MAFQAMIFHQTRISAKEPKELCVYLNAEFVLLSYWLFYTHTSQPSCFSVKGNLLMQFSHQFCLLYAQMRLSLRGRGVRLSTCTYVYSSFCVCTYVYVWMGVVGFDNIPCLMHVRLHIPLPHVACFPRLVVAPGSHGTVIYNKGFPAHTLGRVMLPHKLSSEQCALSTSH